MRVKICGITNLEDAQASVDAGYDALGFIFYRKSPRYIKPAKAKEIIKKLPKGIIKIGVFVNAKEKDIKRIIKLCKLNLLQFHGEESADFCKRFSNFKVIKAFRIKNRIDWDKVLGYKVFAYLFDAFVKSNPGGTGRQFNWGLIAQRQGIKRPIFLSGGLNKNNIQKAIRIVRPEWIDVSSSLEISPGKKDLHKLKEFMNKAKGARA